MLLASMISFFRVQRSRTQLSFYFHAPLEIANTCNGHSHTQNLINLFLYTISKQYSSYSLLVNNTTLSFQTLYRNSCQFKKLQQQLHPKITKIAVLKTWILNTLSFQGVFNLRKQKFTVNWCVVFVLLNCLFLRREKGSLSLSPPQTALRSRLFLVADFIAYTCVSFQSNDRRLFMYQTNQSGLYDAFCLTQNNKQT